MTKKKSFLGLFLFCVVSLTVSIPSQAAYRVQETDAPIVIVIDPGHGGENLGTIENGFEEKSMDLITAQAMYDELCLYDNVEVYMTRTEDVDVSFKARAEYAASVNADFLFSIHYNASEEHDLFGSEVWISAMPPYNAYGYQFGYQFLQEMRDMGLYLRGVKTRINDKGTDYYAIIRESVAVSVPAVIIEHCHVDEERDYPFCDTEEEQAAFGRADATAVAKYFGLKSTALGVDYSQNNELPEADKDKVVQSTLLDETPPDVCMIEIADTDESTGTVVLDVTAADYDSPLLYYEYSYDGGLTYSPLLEWPGSDTLSGAYDDTIQISIQVPSCIAPDIILRAHNMFNVTTESNRITLLRTFIYNENGDAETVDAESDSGNPAEERTFPGTETFMPTINETVEEKDSEVSFLDFLKICLVLVIGLFVLLLISRCIVSYQRRKRRRQRRKESGNNRNHPR